MVGTDYFVPSPPYLRVDFVRSSASCGALSRGSPFLSGQAGSRLHAWKGLAWLFHHRTG